MVTTYSTRLLNLPRLVSSSNANHGKKRKHVEATSHGNSKGDHGHGNRKTPPATAMVPGSKRSAPSGSFYVHIPPHHGHGDSTAAKRRRQREEWQYAAATFQQALKEAGRPPANVASRWRDAGGARVVTSSEFDREEGDMAANAGGDREQGKDRQVEKKPANGTHEEETQVVGDPCGYDDVSSMHMIASLIQSTRGYYSFETCGGGTSQSSVLATKPDQRRATASRAFVGYDAAFSNSERAPSEDSAWTPSGPSDALDDNRRKDVDDDNRSDGQSSCPDSADGGEEEGSLSGEGTGARSPRCALSPTPVPKAPEDRAAFSIVG